MAQLDAHPLDHNAGGPVDPRVLACFLQAERELPGNPASAHQLGRRARSAVEDARLRIARVLGSAVDDVVFCSGGTEANNLAGAGLGEAALPVLLAPVEHPSILLPARRRGAVWWGVDCQGCAVITAPPTAVGLVCLVHAQGEVGAIQPVVEAADLADDLKVPLHVDLAQSLGRLEVTDIVARAASVSVSPHKCGGMRGVGLLVVRNAERRLRPQMLGGAQEHGLRPGTVSPSLAIATALAVELAAQEQQARARRMTDARRAFVQELAGSGVQHRVLTPEGSLPNTTMVMFLQVDGRNLLPAIDLAGVFASHGSACSSGSPQPPAVLLAMGLSEDEARACVRFSCGADLTADAARDAAHRVAFAVQRIQKKN